MHDICCQLNDVELRYAMQKTGAGFCRVMSLYDNNVGGLGIGQSNTTLSHQGRIIACMYWGCLSAQKPCAWIKVKHKGQRLWDSCDWMHRWEEPLSWMYLWCVGVLQGISVGRNVVVAMNCPAWTCVMDVTKWKALVCTVNRYPKRIAICNGKNANISLSCCFMFPTSKFNMSYQCRNRNKNLSCSNTTQTLEQSYLIKSFSHNICPKWQIYLAEHPGLISPFPSCSSYTFIQASLVYVHCKIFAGSVI